MASGQRCNGAYLFFWFASISLGSAYGTWQTHFLCARNFRRFRNDHCEWLSCAWVTDRSSIFILANDHDEIFINYAMTSSSEKHIIIYHFFSFTFCVSISWFVLASILVHVGTHAITIDVPRLITRTTYRFRLRVSIWCSTLFLMKCSHHFSSSVACHRHRNIWLHAYTHLLTSSVFYIYEFSFWWSSSASQIPTKKLKNHLLKCHKNETKFVFIQF